MTGLKPYTVLALRADEPLKRIGVMAFNRSDALWCARELFPHYAITAAVLDADWEEDATP